MLGNSISNWYNTYQNFLKKRCGRPQNKRKDDLGNLFNSGSFLSLLSAGMGKTRLFIVSKTNNIAYLSIKKHRSYGVPNSLYIKKRHNKYWVSFCYESQSQSKQQPNY